MFSKFMAYNKAGARRVVDWRCQRGAGGLDRERVGTRGNVGERDRDDPRGPAAGEVGHGQRQQRDVLELRERKLPPWRFPRALAKPRPSR